jgi:hypothetical protein
MLELVPDRSQLQIRRWCSLQLRVECCTPVATSLPALLYRSPLQAQQSGKDTGSLSALQSGLFTPIDLDNDLNVELLVP